jgi:dihydropyrimidinase
MGILIKGGTVVSATGSRLADVLISGEIIAHVGAGISEAGHEVVDATGLLVMPGGIDVHTHLDMPFGRMITRRGRRLRRWVGRRW